MPRKIKPTPLVTIPVELKEEEESVETTPKSPPAASAPDSEAVDSTNTEATETETETETVTRRPRKKIRRPELSDTIPAIPVAAFHRLVREITADCKSDMRWEAEALKALQVDTEAFMIGKFQKARETLDLFGKSGKTVGDKMLRV